MFDMGEKEEEEEQEEEEGCLHPLFHYIRLLIMMARPEVSNRAS